MLCSNCSEKVKPVVALDVDGTLGNFHRHFWEYARGYLGVLIDDPTAAYSGKIPYKEWFMVHYDIDERTWYDMKLAYRQGGMKRTMAPYPGARALAEFVRSMGAELWLATTRPYNRLDNIDPDTREWLSRHQIPFDYLIYGEGKYQELGSLVDKSRVVAVVDDLPEMYDAAEAEFGSGVAILRRNPFNMAVKRPFVVADLIHEGKNEVGSRIRKWKEKNS